MARVAFCQDTLIEYMGYMQMAAVLERDGHLVEVFFDDQMHPERFAEEVQAFAPDVIAFSVLTPSREWAVRTAAALRSRTGAVTVVGNVDAILNTDAFVEAGAFDLICTGEGEDCLLELCQVLDDDGDWSTLHGFWCVRGDRVIRNPKRSSLVDMDELPAIDRSIYDKYRFFRRSPYLRVYAGRGCPFRCSFCSNTTMTDAYGGSRQYLRKRTPARFVEDIKQLIESRPNQIKRIFIIDEVLWFDRSWLREFLVLYRDHIGVPFTMNFKFNGGVQEDDIRLMAEAGATAVNVAAETGEERLRRGLLNKPVSNAHITEVAGWMHRHGIDFGASAFFGLPGQTFDGHLAELAFYRKLRPRYLWTTFFQPYPGILLADRDVVRDVTPAEGGFDTTVHSDMYLDLPDRTRLVNLKKCYHLMYRFPVLERPLAWLCQFRVPLVFDALFVVPFLGLARWAEGCSTLQFLTHARNFVINPFVRRNQPLNMSGRSYDIGYDQGRASTSPVSDPLDQPSPSTNSTSSTSPVSLSAGPRR